MGKTIKKILAKLVVLVVVLNASCATTQAKKEDRLVDVGLVFMPESQIKHEHVSDSLKKSFFDNGDMMTSDLILGYYATEENLQDDRTE